MIYKTFDRMEEKKKKSIRDDSRKFLSNIDKIEV
jgi:hypothetical protein